jgi:adenylosuccinate lyase
MKEDRILNLVKVIKAIQKLINNPNRMLLMLKQKLDFLIGKKQMLSNRKIKKRSKNWPVF